MPNTRSKLNIAEQLNNKFQLPSALNMPVLFYYCQNNRDWTIKFISHSCEKILGYSAFHFLSHKINLGNLINSKDQEMVWDTVQSALKEQMAFQLLYQMTTASHENKIIYEQGEGIFNEHDKLVELTGFLFDITDYYHANYSGYLNGLEKCAAEITAQASLLKSNRGIKLRTLSAREVETLLHLCQGKKMKEIGREMGISPRTVEINLRHAKTKLYCRTQLELRKLFYMTESGQQLIISRK